VCRTPVRASHDRTASSCVVSEPEPHGSAQGPPGTARPGPDSSQVGTSGQSCGTAVKNGKVDTHTDPADADNQSRPHTVDGIAPSDPWDEFLEDNHDGVG